MKDVWLTVSGVVTRDMIEEDGCDSFEPYCDSKYLKEKAGEVEKNLEGLYEDVDTCFMYDEEKDEITLDVSLSVTVTDGDYEDGDFKNDARRDVEKACQSVMGIDLETEDEIEIDDVNEYTSAEEEMEEKEYWDSQSWYYR